MPTPFASVREIFFQFPEHCASYARSFITRLLLSSTLFTCPIIAWLSNLCVICTCSLRSHVHRTHKSLGHAIIAQHILRVIYRQFVFPSPGYPLYLHFVWLQAKSCTTTHDTLIWLWFVTRTPHFCSISTSESAKRLSCALAAGMWRGCYK